MSPPGNGFLRLALRDWGPVRNQEAMPLPTSLQCFSFAFLPFCAEKPPEGRGYGNAPRISIPLYEKRSCPA